MAGSVKLFQFFQKFHQIIGIFPSHWNQKYLSTNLIRTICLICLTQILLSTVAFFAFEAKSMFSYGFSFTMAISIMNPIVFYSIFIWQSENTLKFIENCERFIEKRMHSTAVYEQLIEKIEKFHRVFSFLLGNATIFLYITVAPYSFVRYFLFDMGENSFLLFLPSWYPFDWKIPAGYLMAWLLQCAGGVTVTFNGLQFMNFLIGSIWLFIFIADDIKHDVAGFNVIVTTTTKDNRSELAKRFCDIVKIYSDAKQCVTEFKEIFEYTLFADFSLALFGLAGMLVTLQFQLWDDDSSPFEMGLSSIILIMMILIVFVLCEPGARMTNQFEIFSNEFGQCNWYSLSLDMQRMYLIFLSDTQHPIIMQSYAGITCERETMKRILNGAYSYFSTFRNFEP